MELTRAYKLPIYGNKYKLESLRYTASRFNKYVQHFSNLLYYNSSIKYVSTKGMGRLPNQAQRKAIGIINVVRGVAKATTGKSNCPVYKKLACPGKILKSNNSSFEYWVWAESQFDNKRIYLPIKSHKRFNKALKLGWRLVSQCELYIDKTGQWYALIFLHKIINKAIPYKETIGCDVGYKYSVVRSDGHMGKKISTIIKQQRDKNSERQRQKHKKKNSKSVIKQLLDIEAKNAVNVSLNSKKSLVVENPKVLANLRSGNLHGWARSYFANRCHILGKEQGVYVWEVNPAYTSITCSECGITDKQSRVNRNRFICFSCESEFHADINAARNIALKGTESLIKYIIK